MDSGLIRQPKWGHLRELHAAVKLCSKPLLSGEQTAISLGEHQQVRALSMHKGAMSRATDVLQFVSQVLIAWSNIFSQVKSCL